MRVLEHDDIEVNRTNTRCFTTYARLIHRYVSHLAHIGAAKARVFGNSPDFWLNVQRRTDLWMALNSPQALARIERARPVSVSATVG